MRKHFFQTETRDGPNGQDTTQTHAHAPHAGAGAQAQTRRQQLRPPALLHVLGELCADDNPVDILAVVRVGADRRRLVQAVQHGKFFGGFFQL